MKITKELDEKYLRYMVIAAYMVGFEDGRNEWKEPRIISEELFDGFIRIALKQSKDKK